jgi:tRNA-2-methylthio-N6-dimethylallyladenosine synthase
MRRPYSIQKFRQIINKLRALRPDIYISTDIIVGFPGETDADFEATRSAFETIRFDMAYIFKYSVRPGTTAELKGDPISKETKEERNQILLDILGRSSLARNQSLVGTTQEVLLEGKAKRGDNMFIGRTRGHRKVIVPASERLVGQLVDVNITDATVSSLNGELIITD